MTKGIEITGFNANQFGRDLDNINASIPGFDRVIVHRTAESVPGARIDTARLINRVPSIEFRAYHPDTTFAFIGPHYLQGPMNANHSLILLAAHELGIGADDAIKLFCPEVFGACGYFDLWEMERDAMLRPFDAAGISLHDTALRWGRHEPFMHTFNHPKIRCLFDLADAFLSSVDVPHSRVDLLPVDNLVFGPCYPVYPAIAERYGVSGSYDFKPQSGYSVIGLREFVVGSLDVYRAHPVGSIKPDAAVQARFDLVKHVIQEFI